MMTLSFAASIARGAVPAFVALALAACGGKEGGGSASSAKVNPYLQDVVMGDANAPVTVLEYASLTCSHCRDFWAQDFPRMKTEYIDTGKVKYILRDFPTDPDLAVAGIAIARCKGPDSYYAIVGDFFQNQYDIMMAAREGAAGAKLAALGARHGVAPDEIAACVDDKRIRDFVNKTIEEGNTRGVKATPTVFVNDKIVRDHSYDNLKVYIANALDPSVPLPAEDGQASPTTEAPPASPAEPAQAPPS